MLLRENNGLEVVTVARGRAADEAGMRVWDRIMVIDGIPTLGLRLPEAMLLLRGPVGSRTTLLVQSPDRSGPAAVTLVRQAIDPQHMDWKN